MSKSKGKRPNIIFFFTDQHSSQFLGVSNVRDEEGRPLSDTPNLDRLAQSGVYCSNSYCQNPLCVPSRSSMLTGEYSKHLGIYENRHILEPDALTIPKLLSQAGYRTALIGKAHFNGEQWHGYQQRPYGDILGQAHQSEYLRTGHFRESEHGLEDLLDNSGSTDIPLALTQTEICVAESVKWLQEHALGAQQPFFLSVNFDKPHFPYRAPQRLYEKYIDRVKLADTWELSQQDTGWMVEFVQKAFEVNGGWEHWGKDKEIHRRALAAYCACVEWVDDAIGRIIDAMTYLGLIEDTLIVYASDHGEMASEKGAWQKSVFYDQSVKVPMIFSWPGYIRENSITNELVGLIDLMPTFAEYGQCLEGCADKEGLSLKALLEQGVPLDRTEIFAESVVLKVPEHAGCMMRTQRFKYNYYLVGRHELYDMENDPNELNNAINDSSYASTAAMMKARIETFWKPDQQWDRYHACPRVAREKHFHLSANQFVSSDGVIIEAFP